MRRVAALIGSLVIVVAPSVAQGADEVPVATIITESADLDGATIVVRGELVGDFLRRSDVVWVQLNGDAYVDAPSRAGGGRAGGNVGIGARIPGTLAVLLEGEHPGGYRWRGPVVLATGVWRHHDPGRGGESYLDVVGLVVLESALPTHGGAQWWALAVGGLLMAAGAAPLMASRRRTA